MMSFDYILAGLVAIGILLYLAYALLRPERF
jgi:K+-transporting ATPase KdpF subunit